jgi:RNA recognition motif-containing protein
VNGFCARILHFVRRADAERAKRDLHMQTFHGRPMHVEWYRHTPDDAIGGEMNNSRSEPVVSVHVRFMTVEVRKFFPFPGPPHSPQVDMKVDEHLLYHVFKKYGEVTKISIKALIQDKVPSLPPISSRLNPSQDTNLSRGYAFVHFTPNLIGCQSALEAAAGMDDVMYK